MLIPSHKGLLALAAAGLLFASVPVVRGQGQPAVPSINFQVRVTPPNAWK